MEVEGISKQLFGLADEIFNYCNGLYKKVEIKEPTEQKILVTALFLKILSRFESVLLLYGRGFFAEASIIMRVNVVAIAIFKLISEDSNNIQKLKKRDNYNTKRLILRLKDNGYEGLDFKATEKIMTKEAKTWRDIDIVQGAGMEKFYDFCYRDISEEVHTSIRKINEHIILKDEQLYIIDHPMPNENFNIGVMNLLIIMMIIAMENFANIILKKEISKDIESFEKRMATIINS